MAIIILRNLNILKLCVLCPPCVVSNLLQLGAEGKCTLGMSSAKKGPCPIYGFHKTKQNIFGTFFFLSIFLTQNAHLMLQKLYPNFNNNINNNGSLLLKCLSTKHSLTNKALFMMFICYASCGWMHLEFWFIICGAHLHQSDVTQHFFLNMVIQNTNSMHQCSPSPQSACYQVEYCVAVLVKLSLSRWLQLTLSFKII